MTKRGHGEGTIYKYRNGWAAAVRVGWREGKHKRHFVYGKTRKEVSDKLRVLTRAIESGQPINADQTLAVYLEHWLLTLPGNVRPRTEHSYADIVHRHIIPVLGHIKLKKLTPTDVRRLVQLKQAETSARGRPHSARSVQYMHAVLRRAIEQARREELVARNVAALVPPPVVRRAEVEPFSIDEARKLLAAARSDRLYALYAVAIGLGLRKGETLGLAWDDVDFDTRTLYVRSSLQRVSGHGLVLAEPKTLRSKRRIPLPEICYDALVEHRKQQQGESEPEWWFNEYNLVFVTTIGTPIEPRNLSRHYTGLCQKAGVPVRRFHDLRHTCASLLLAQGVDARTIMDTLGHTMIATTMNLYAHVAPVTQRLSAERMDAALGRLQGANGSTNGSTGAEIGGLGTAKPKASGL